MIDAELRKVGDEFHVVVPESEVKRLGLVEGQPVSVSLEPRSDPTVLRPAVRDALEASWRRNEAGYRYLAGR
jgi:hypothetical protein